VHKLRKTPSGYYPKLICLGGLDVLKKAKEEGKEFISAWVGNRILASKLSIMADDAIGCNDLQSKLRKLISEAYSKRSPVTPADSDEAYAFIVEVYPFENYLIFDKGGEKFRQAYKLDKLTREVALEGRAKKVFEQYVDVADSKGMQLLQSSSDISRSLKEALYDRPNSAAPALGGFNGPLLNKENNGVFTHFGAPGSEVNNPQLKLMLNVEDALDMYESERADGIHKVVYSPYAPIPPGLINAEREAKIAASIAGVDNFSVMDFFRWQDKKLRIKASERTKRIEGKELSASQFAYVGDYTDISTWQLRMDTPGTAKESLKLVASAPIPKKAIVNVTSRLKAAMGKHGPHIGKGKRASVALKKLQQRKNNGSEVKIVGE
jgi:hypothetical protein